MKLIIARPSPYARKARIALIEKGIEFETIIENPWLPETNVPSANPLGKVPALILGDGRVVHDSKVIVEYLETLGIPPVYFLALPRLVALTLMMPLLALYANCLGILGGMAVGAGVLDIPPAAYWIETQSIIDLSDVSTGLIKAFAFGVLISLAGCLRGLQAERSAAGVGRAATSAVVTSVLLIIVADSVFAVIFNYLGW